MAHQFASKYRSVRDDEADNCVYISGRELMLASVTPQMLRASLGACLFLWLLSAAEGAMSASLWHPEKALLAPALISLRNSALAPKKRTAANYGN
jgi:hypothetical protein